MRNLLVCPQDVLQRGLLIVLGDPLVRGAVAEVPRLLAEKLSIRALLRRVGVTDAHLSRVLRGVAYKTPSGDLARRVARALDLSDDYFPEYREAFVIERIKRDFRLSEDLYRKLRKSHKKSDA